MTFIFTSISRSIFTCAWAICAGLSIRVIKTYFSHVNGLENGTKFQSENWY